VGVRERVENPVVAIQEVFIMFTPRVYNFAAGPAAKLKTRGVDMIMAS
jgi:hypothetical protein